MGSAAALHLARAGARVIGIDASLPPNSLGSSHGDTRITRLAVGEGPAYVPLVRRSHELWREYEEELSSELLVQCGGLILGGLASSGQHGVGNFVAATIDIARSHGIDHEILSADEMLDRFGVLAVTDEVGYFERSAGYLRASACIHAQHELAVRAGAAIRLNEPVLQWSATTSGVRVETEEGAIDASVLVLTAGPWLPSLLPGLAPLLSVQRQVQFWYEMERDGDRFSEMPVFIWMHGTEEGAYLYGFPAIDGLTGGVKVATEVFADATSPLDVERRVTDDEAERMHSAHVRGRIPGLSARCVRSAVCLYTVTPDFGFIIDWHPEHRSVLVASPCSGHGFKHSAAVGECVAQLALTGSSSIDISAFGLDRFMS
jgi:sarcosine oxidase